VKGEQQKANQDEPHVMTLANDFGFLSRSGVVHSARILKLFIFHAHHKEPE
jgi:hypothetical protein